MRWLNNITGGYSSSAKVVGSTLVLSLPDASAPIVWRMDLEEIKAAAFEIKQTPDGFTLIMKTPKGAEQPIAPFDNKSKAMRALMAASDAMEHAHVIMEKNIANDSGRPVTAPAAKKSGQMAAGIVGLLILAGLIFALTQIGPRPPQSTGGGFQASVSGAAGTSAPTGAAPGVPVSADDFLRAR